MSNKKPLTQQEQLNRKKQRNKNLTIASTATLATALVAGGVSTIAATEVNKKERQDHINTLVDDLRSVAAPLNSYTTATDSENFMKDMLGAGSTTTGRQVPTASELAAAGITTLSDVTTTNVRNFLTDSGARTLTGISNITISGVKAGKTSTALTAVTNVASLSGTALDSKYVQFTVNYTGGGRSFTTPVLTLQNTPNELKLNSFPVTNVAYTPTTTNYLESAVETASNWRVTASGGVTPTVSSVSVTTNPVTNPSTGVDVDVVLALGDARRTVNKSLMTFNKMDRSSLISSTMMTGWTIKTGSDLDTITLTNSTANNAVADLIFAAKDYASVQFSTDNGTTFDDLLTSTQLATQSSTRSALTNGVALSTNGTSRSVQQSMTGTTKHPVQLRILNTAPTTTYLGAEDANHALTAANTKTTIATTGLNATVTPDASWTAANVGNSVQFGGTSTGITFQLKSGAPLVLPTGTKLQIKVGNMSTWTDVTSTTSTAQTVNNLWNNATGAAGAWSTNTFSWQIVANTGYVLKSGGTTSGTNAPADFTGVTKMIDGVSVQSMTIGGTSKVPTFTNAPTAAQLKNMHLEFSFTNFAPAGNIATTLGVSGADATVANTGVYTQQQFMSLMANGNFFNGTGFAYSTLKVRVAADAGFSFTNTVTAANMTKELWSTTTPPLTKHIDVAAGSAATGITVGGVSTAPTWTEPPRQDATYMYSIDGGTSWKTKAELLTAITNLGTGGMWNAATGAWRVTSIKVKLVAKSGYSLSSDGVSEIWNSSSTAISKSIETATTLAKIQAASTGLNVNASTSTHQAVVWNNWNTLQQYADSLGLVIKFKETTSATAPTSIDGTWSSTPPATIGETKNTRYLWVGFVAKNAGDTVAPTITNITTSSGIQGVNILRDVTAQISAVTDAASFRSKVSFTGSSLASGLTITDNWSSASQGYHVELRVGSGPSAITASSVAAFKAALVAANYNFWDNANNQWRDNGDIEYRLVADTGYTLTGDGGWHTVSGAVTNLTKVIVSPNQLNGLTISGASNAVVVGGVSTTPNTVTTFQFVKDTSITGSLSAALGITDATLANKLDTNQWLTKAELDQVLASANFYNKANNKWAFTTLNAKFSAAGGFNLDGGDQTKVLWNNSTAVGSVTKFIETVAGDNNAVIAAGGNTKNFTINLPTNGQNANLFDIKFQLVRTQGDTELTAAAPTNFATVSGTNWKTAAEIQTYVSGLTEGLWNSAEGKWVASSIRVKLVPKAGYSLSDAQERDLWTNSTNTLTKFVDVSSTLSGLQNASTGIKVDSNIDHQHLTWTANSNTLVAAALAKGIVVEFAESQTSAAPSSGWSSTLPTTTDYETGKRHLFMKLSASNGYVLSAQTPTTGIYDITTSSGIAAVRTFIDTSSIVINPGVFAGDSHNLTGATTTVDRGFNNNGTARYEVHYSLSGFNSLPAGLAGQLGLTGADANLLKPEMTEAEFKALFNGSRGNLFNQTTNTWIVQNVSVKLAPKDTQSETFKLSDDKATTIDLDTLTGFNKFVKTATLGNIYKTGGNAVVAQSTSEHNAPVWSTLPDLTAGAFATPWAGIGTVEFLSGNFGTEAAASASNAWSTSLPTSVDFTHANRHLWVRFTAASGYALDTRYYDLTTTSGIQGIISNVDANNATWANIDLTDVTLTGTTALPTLTEVTAPTGSVLNYSLDGGTTWLDKNTFITQLKVTSNLNIHIRDLKVKFVSTDASKFVIHNNHEALIDVTGLKTYRDVTAELAKMIKSTSTTDVNAGIRLEGIINETDSVMISIPQLLSETALSAKGLVLQFSINGGAYENFQGGTTDQAADPAKGFSAAPAGQYQIITLPKPNATTAPTVSFRIVPNLDDEGHAPATAFTSATTWLERVNALQLTTSDIVNRTTSGPTVLVWDASTLPELVKTSATDLNVITATGNSKDLAISQGTLNEATALDGHNNNTHNGYEAYIKVGYQVRDGRLDNNYYFLKDDFINWLDGDFTVSGANAVNGSNPVKVYNAATNTMVNLPAAMAKPDWNSIDMSTFVARWISINDKYRASDPATFSIASTNILKWTDLTTFINDLKMIDISGDTAHLVSTDDATNAGTTLDAVKAALDAKFGADVFKIVSTSGIQSSAPVFTGTGVNTADNALPSEINFLYDLGFKIVPGANGANFVASLVATDTETAPTTVWDKSTSSTILKYVHTNTNDLATLSVLSGNTKALQHSIDASLRKYDNNGNKVSTGGNDALDVYVKTSATGANNTYMPMDVMVAYLSGNLEFVSNKLRIKSSGSTAAVDITAKYGTSFGFTASNLTPPAFDGTWGNDTFTVKWIANAGYTTDAANLAAEVHPNVAGLDRYLDISAIVSGAIAGASSIKVTSPDTTQGWWSEAAGDYSDHRTWNGYIDNHNFDLTDITIPSALHIKVQYSLDNSTWSDNKPTTLVDTTTNRHLYIRFQYNGTEYNSGETGILSDTASKDITTNSGVQGLLIHVDKGTADLSQIAFTGDTRHITEVTTGVNLPTNTHIEYSITNFQSSNSSSSTEQQNAKDVLAAMGILPTGATATVYNAYMANPSMTLTEFKAWIAQAVAVTGVEEILRSSISARIVPNTGYSMTQIDDSSTRSHINVSGLYTFRNISNMINYLHLAASSGAQDGINLYGQKSTQDGILVQVPDALVTLLNNSGLKLQWTTDGKSNGSTTGSRVTLGDTPTWHDAALGNIAADPTKGWPQVNNGFVTTLNPIVNGESFIGFRIVPIVDDEGVAVTGDVNGGDTTWTITQYFNAVMTRLFTTDTALAANFYYIDTTQIPTVIKVDGIDLSNIVATGNTKELDIAVDTSLPNLLGANSQVDSRNTDNTLDNNLQLLFAIDNADGTFVNGNASGGSVVWLTREDFIEYLKGGLIVRGNKVVWSSNPAKEVEVLSPLIATRPRPDDISTTSVDESTQIGLRDGDKFMPNYLLINSVSSTGANSIFVKWASTNADYANLLGTTRVAPFKDYIPSDIAPHALSFNPQTVRRYFDGVQMINQIRALVVQGDTHAWTFDYTNAPLLEPTTLASYGLKLQYSLNGTTWSDSSIDFMAATWAQQVARTMLLRVVPIATTSTGALTGKIEQDGIVVDYRSATGSKAEANPITNKAANGVDLFQVYLDIDKALLANIVITGNTFELATGALDESSIDTNQEKFSEVTIEYLFNGAWYSKSELLTEMQRIRTAASTQAGATALRLPTDFTHTTVQARWRVTQPNAYVIKDSQTVSERVYRNGVVDPNVTTPVTKEVSAQQEITKTNFKTFVNVWDVQTIGSVGSNFLDSFTRTDGGNTLRGQDALIQLSGSINSASGDILLESLQSGSFANHHMKLQWSVQENPSTDLNSADWNDKDNSLTGTKFLQDQPLNPRTRKLWIRFVPTDATNYVLSNTSGNGLGTVIAPIEIDTTKMKFSVDVDSNALKNMTVSGNTQSGFTADINPFLVAHTKGAGFGVDGIARFYELNADGTEQDIIDEAGVNRIISTYGLTIKFRVTATRTKGGYTAGQVVTFESLAEFKAALATTNLNFDRSTLEMSWGIKAATQYSNFYTVDDTTWVKPLDVSGIINIIYTEDIYTLDKDSFVVSGNDIKLQAPVPSPTQLMTLTAGAPNFMSNGNAAKTVLLASYLSSKGIKIQYNILDTDANNQPDANGWTDTAPTGGLNGEKDYWVRFTNISADYQLASNTLPNNPEQVTKVEVQAIKLAIPFDFDNIQDILDAIAAARIEGTTYDFNYVTGNELPTPNASADGVRTHYRIQYSRDGRNWANDIAGALVGSDYYQTGVLAFDKDRGDQLYIRYVYEETSGNVTPANSTAYVFTDTLGNELTLAQLTSTISINDLIQPVRIDQTIGELTGQTSVTVNGLTNPTGAADFTNTRWDALANFGAFKPNFIPGGSDTVADFTEMRYDGMEPTAANNFLFNLGRNPFDSSDISARDKWNALAPRHTHFQFRYKSTVTSQWGAWQDTPMTDMNKSSNYKGFEVRIVADAGFSIPDGSWTSGSTFALDGSSRTSGTNIPSQAWSHEYNIVVELRTANISVPNTPEAQAKFVGFNDQANPRGTFMTDDANGNYSIGNIMINFLENGIAYDVAAARGYVLEYNVLDSSKQPISWTDKNGVTATGWHTSGATPTDAPTSTVPWYGPYPTSLKNGDIIRVRLRARNGFVITSDTQSDAYDAASKTSPWSHTMELKPVQGLVNKITVPTDFAFYDTAAGHMVDMKNNPITVNGNYPTVSFSGNEGTGRITITDPNRNREFHYEVAVLRPIPPVGNGASYNVYQEPVAGYRIQDANGNWVPLYTPTAGWNDRGDKEGFDATGAATGIMDWKEELIWQNPANVTDLSVGDVVVFRLVANTGYGFEYQDRDTRFDDILIPKDNSDEIYGAAATAATTQLKFDVNEGKTPLPVRGLTVRPPVALSTLSLVYSQDPKERLNTGTTGSANIVLNTQPDPRQDKWEWIYQTMDADTGTWSSWQNVLPTNLQNGDKIRVKASVLPGFILDSSYDNTVKEFTVAGLKDAINIDQVPRPVIQVGGYEGHGTIMSISQANIPGRNYTPSLWSAAGGRMTQQQIAQGDAPVIPTPILPGATAGHGIKWQYLVSDSDPATMSNTELQTLDRNWTDTPPTDLRNGQFVRMRIVTEDPDEVALGYDKVVYSYTDGGYENSASANDQLKIGWVKVTGMMLNPDNIDVELGITGFIGKTVLDPKFTVLDLNGENVLDEKAVTLEYSIDGGIHWLKSNDPSLKGLTNGTHIQIRAVAKPGWNFNTEDNAVATDPDGIPDSGDETVGVTISPDGMYMTKSTWIFEVSGLLKYLDTQGVTLDEFQVIAGQGNPGRNGEIVDGYGTISPIGMQGAGTIADVAGNFIDPITGQPYSELVGVRYRVRKVDQLTGSQNPEYIIDTPGDVPTGLSNGDIIIVELYSKNPDFKLSNDLSRQITITGLITTIDEEVSDPILQFDGASGAGTVVVSPTSPNRTKWIFNVVHSPVPGEPLPPIDDALVNDLYASAPNPADKRIYPNDQYTQNGLVYHADGTPVLNRQGIQLAVGDHLVDNNGDDYSTWLGSAPANLRNGDYVIARLVSSVPGAGGLRVNNISRPGEIPMNANWIKVSGLAMRIDLSRLQFGSLLDPIDPRNPGRLVRNEGDRNFAFKLVGEQEGEAYLELNSPFYSDNFEERLRDMFGNVIPDEYAQYLQWGFAVNDNPENSLDYQYSSTLPNRLQNGQYIHVTIMVKPGYDNITVYGFKPMTFQIDGLIPPASISSKMITMIASVVGGVVVLGASVGGVFMFRKRKKKLKVFED